MGEIAYAKPQIKFLSAPSAVPNSVRIAMPHHQKESILSESEFGHRPSVSIFFYTGDFAGAFLRFKDGREQGYATHNEICLLVEALKELGFRCVLYSFITSEPFDLQIDNVRFVGIGAKSFDCPNLLRIAVENDKSEILIPHFPNLELLCAVKKTGRRAMAFLASSYYHRSVLAPWRRYKLARQLNHKNLELVANHCRPSTLHLAAFGVNRSKLIAWDVPHRYEPNSFVAKRRNADTLRLAYAGTVTKAKGVTDLIYAISIIGQHRPVSCSIAGSGDVEEMQSLANRLGVKDVHFLGQIANDEVFAMYQQADLAIVPSRREFPEGFPLTMFEAIASRTPIICSDHPIFTAVLADGENAAIFKNGDPASLARAILRVAEDVDIYAKLSDNALMTWTSLNGTADWKTLIIEWITNGENSPWIQDYKICNGKLL